MKCPVINRESRISLQLTFLFLSYSSFLSLTFRLTLLRPTYVLHAPERPFGKARSNEVGPYMRYGQLGRPYQRLELPPAVRSGSGHRHPPPGPGFVRIFWVVGCVTGSRTQELLFLQVVFS